MDGKLMPTEAKILEAINNGTLTNEKLEGGLIALIQEEMNQNERPANMELVNACEELLFRIHNYEYISHKADSLAKAKNKLTKQAHKKSIYTVSLRIAAVIILLIGGNLIADVLIRDERLVDYSNDDEQQHIVSGEIVEGPYNEALADNDALLEIQNGSKWREIIDMLGYVPEAPTWLPEGWKVQDYYASTSRYVSVFRIQYEHAEYSNLIKYSESRYTDVEMAVSTFEQSYDGKKYQWNDLPVYISINMDEFIAVWIKDQTCYSVSGPLSLDEIELIINSIRRSNE